MVGFLAHSGEAAQASSAHGPELEAALQKFPRFLVEFRQTMGNLKEFSDAGTPLLEGARRRRPVADRRDPRADPVLGSDDGGAEEPRQGGRRIRARSSPRPNRSCARRRSWRSPAQISTEELAKLFVSLQKTGGWDGLTELIYNTAASLNGFDKYGHFGRTLVTLSTCLEYIPKAEGYSGCVARFNGPNSSSEETSATSGSSEGALIQLLTERWAKNGSQLVAGAEEKPSLGEAKSTGTAASAATAQSNRAAGRTEGSRKRRRAGTR